MPQERREVLGHALSDFRYLTWQKRLPLPSFIPKEIGFLKPCLISEAEGDICTWSWDGAHSLSLKLTWDKEPEQGSP